MTIATDTTPGRFRGWLHRVFGGPSAVYGLILYAALIAGVSDESTDSLEVLIVSFISLIIFFIAHVFAHTLSDHGEHGFWRALEGGVRESVGMLYAAIPSTLALIAGVVTRMDADDSVGLALLVATLVLGALGYSAYARRGAGTFVRIVGAVGTAILGFAIMLLNYAVH